jgi:hypothetical protein
LASSISRIGSIYIGEFAEIAPVQSPSDEEARRDTMTSKRNTAVWLAAFAVLGVAVGGCSKQQQTDSQATAAPVSQTAATQPAAASPAAADANAQPQGTTSGAAAPASAAVASADGDQTGTKFEVNSLVRGSDVVTLKFSVINGAADKLVTFGKFNDTTYNNSYRDVSGIHLIDTVSKKKYFPLSDTDKNCVCSREVADIAANSRASLWVKFPAPPAGVTKITVEAPHFIPLDSVPITQ